MKKLTLFFLSLLACGLAFQACDNTKTYAEMLEGPFRTINTDNKYRIGNPSER